MTGTGTVEVVHWNPRRSILPGRLGRSRIGRSFPIKKAVGNFGDMLGPILVDRILGERDTPPASGPGRRLLAVGSIMGLSGPGDTVWGAGVNGRGTSIGAAPALDVRAVRGPVTKRLLEEVGTFVPEVFGDPAVLWPRFWDISHYASSSPKAEFSVIPHFLDPISRHLGVRAVRSLVNPRRDPHYVISQIVNSKLVVSSSLHGLILAEAYGIPARLLIPTYEPLLKYEDYYLGTGRANFRPATTLEEALDLSGEPQGSWDPQTLLDVFPWDLWQ